MYLLSLSSHSFSFVGIKLIAALHSICMDRNLAFSLYTCAWKLASEKDALPLNSAPKSEPTLNSNSALSKFAPPLNLIPEKYTPPKNCESEKYTEGAFNSFLDPLLFQNDQVPHSIFYPLAKV